MYWTDEPWAVLRRAMGGAAFDDFCLFHDLREGISMVPLVVNGSCIPVFSKATP